MRNILVVILYLITPIFGLNLIGRDKANLPELTNISYSQSNVFNQRSGLAKLSLGIGINIIPLRSNILSRFNQGLGTTIKFADLSIGNKFYENKDNSYFYFDFLLTKLEGAGKLSKYFHRGGCLKVLEKDTKLYSEHDYEWISLSLNYGLDISNAHEELFILPSVFIKAGLRTFYPDTINVSGLNEDGKKLKWDFINTGVIFKTIYKGFTFDYILNYNVLSSAAYLSNSLQLKYSFTNLGLTYLNLYLNYKNELLVITQEENNREYKINNRIESFNFGVNFQPFLFFNDITIREVF